MEVVIDAVSKLGFPIACCVVLGWYLKVLIDQFREDVKLLTEKYDKAVEKFSRTIDKNTVSIDKNTLVLTSLETRLGTEGSVKNEGQL